MTQFRNHYEPPAGLSDFGRSLWRQCLTARRAELWDAPALEMLAMLCRIWSTWQRVQSQIEETEPGAPEFAQLVRLADSLAGRAATIATKMRLTPQSLDKKTAAVKRAPAHRIDFGAVA